MSRRGAGFVVLTAGRADTADPVRLSGAECLGPLSALEAPPAGAESVTSAWATPVPQARAAPIPSVIAPSPNQLADPAVLPRCTGLPIVPPLTYKPSCMFVFTVM
ncbi:hypothetical protein MSZK_59340 [Mycobacterium sp. shizuoka-1]|nr:hypothetical protein MSZK_59340 [Mycobacterium sp. shizuoka-1]